MEYKDAQIQISEIQNIFNEIIDPIDICPKIQKLFDIIIGIKLISIDFRTGNLENSIFLIVYTKHLNDTLLKIKEYPHKFCKNDMHAIISLSLYELFCYSVHDYKSEEIN